MLQFCLIVCLAAHLLAVNLASAGPLVCIWLRRRELQRDDVAAGLACRWLAVHSMTALTAGMLLGGAALWILIVTDSTYLHVWRAIPARRLWFGAAELAFFYVCLAAYLYLGSSARWRKTHAMLAMLAATDLIYHFPPLFAVVMALKQSPSPPQSALSYRELLDWLVSAEVLAHVGHFVIASFAVAGGALLWFARKIAISGNLPDAGRVFRWGGRLALAATALNLLAGLLLLMAAPAAQRDRLLGGDLVAASLFVASMLGVFLLLGQLTAAANSDYEPRLLWRCLGLLVLVVMLMTAARQAMQGSATSPTLRQGRQGGTWSIAKVALQRQSGQWDRHSTSCASNHVGSQNTGTSPVSDAGGQSYSGPKASQMSQSP